MPEKPEITPVAAILIVVPSIFTPPNIEVLAVGKLYAIGIIGGVNVKVLPVRLKLPLPLGVAVLMVNVGINAGVN